RSARAWLFTIAANLWRDEVRRRTRGPKQTDLSPECQQDTSVTPDRKLIEREDVRRTLTAMEKLPTRQREVLYLYSCDALSLAEIADVLGISSDAVKASLSLARKKMRRELEDLSPNRFPRDEVPP
ncbi:MAG: RNA polymerase sigma factor, partial [Pirellulales bacterium]